MTSIPNGWYMVIEEIKIRLIDLLHLRNTLLFLSNRIVMICTMKENIYIQTYNSPCGTIIIGSYGDKVCLCDWYERKNRQQIDQKISATLHATFKNELTVTIEKVTLQLNEYFNGGRTEFDLPLLLAGTSFQEKTWQLLMQIPYGTTTSYSSIALLSGNIKSVRAMATAIGANRLSILIPCHRVIGSNGKLTGYAGGLEAKKYLISLEKQG